MKINFFSFLYLFVTTLCYSQFGEQQIISIEAAQPRGVFSADLDGDMDMDVLTTSVGDEKIAWYENIDGQGAFGSQHIISQSLIDPVGIFAADLDGDSNLDILVASKGVSQYESKVVWYKNLDGMGNFSDYIIITELVQGALAVFAADLDGDLDLDVLSASFTDNKIAWYENTDGQGTFGSQNVISNLAWSVRDVFACDIDGDNDMDVIAPITSSDQIVWYENTNGLGNFNNMHIISTDVNGCSSIFVADIDGDVDLDVISISGGDNKIYWHENSDGLGNFTTQHTVTEHLLAVSDVFAVDIDNDEDIDILASSANDDYVCWYKNLDGQGNFSTENIISTETDFARAVYSSDIDGDGDNDVLSASYVDNKIAWYNNYTLSVADLEYNPISIYPNPTANSLFIKSEVLKIKSIVIFDILGKKILSQNKDLFTIDVSQIDKGVYLLELNTDSGKILEKIIKN